MFPNILEILDGVKKLAEIEDLRFRYYKNFRSPTLITRTYLKLFLLDKDAYDIKIKETHLENYKNFSSNSYAESNRTKR